MMKSKKLIAALLSMALVLVFALPAYAAAPDGAKYFGFEDSLDGAKTTGALGDQAGGNITFADGKVGKAAVFDGNSGLNLGKDIIKSYTYTVAAWVKVDSLTNHTPIFVGLPDADHFVSLVPYSWGNVYGIWMHNAGNDPEWADLFHTAPLDTGKWVHTAFTVDKGALKLYVDGKEVYKNDTGALDVLSGGGEYFLGVNYWDAAFAGMIDEVYVYNGKALTAAQITDVMNAVPVAEDSGTAPAPAPAPNPKTGDHWIALSVAALILSAGAFVLLRKKVTA